MNLGHGDVIYIMMSYLTSFVLLLYLAPFRQIRQEILKGQMRTDPSLQTPLPKSVMSS